MNIIQTTTKYQTYPKYKPSGINWLGDIPERWEAKRFGFLFSFNKGLSITKENLQDEGIPCVNYGEIHSKYGFEVNPLKNELRCVSNSYLENNQGSVLHYGNFVFADTSEDVEGAGNFTYLNSHELTFAGYHTIVTRPKIIINFRFLAYLFDSVSFRKQIRSMVAGIKVYSITKDILKNCYVLLPPSLVQQSIADFLDREIAKIDEMVAKKQKMMDLLKEKRQALITHAVTKGLDPKAKMKASGIDWLGDIPEEWEVKRLRFLSDGFFQYGANEEAVEENSENPRYIRITDIKDNGDLYEETFRSLPPEIASQYLLEDGDILFARSGATVGKTFRYKKSWGKCCYAGYLIKMTPDKKKIFPEFLYYFVQSHSYIEWKDSIFWQSTIQNISAEKYKNFIVCYPKIEEQKKIADFLDRETAKIDEMMKKVGTQIEKLQEYRQALISNVVTGKVMVT